MAGKLPKPECYVCGKTARWSIMFCSKACAAHIAIGLFEGTDDWFWCPDCRDWVNIERYMDFHYGGRKLRKCYGTKAICVTEYMKEVKA